MSVLKCIECGKESDRIGKCECGGLLEVVHDFGPIDKAVFDERRGSGVWRFKELVHPTFPKHSIVSLEEGNTNVYEHDSVKKFVGMRMKLKHEGQNPTGSFKDRGMTVAISEAKRCGSRCVACASTGNTSASLAAYAAFAGIEAIVFVPKGNIALGKLAQTMAYGAHVHQVDESFDAAMERVQKQNAYLVNSINPWRIEGQKTIIFELLQQSGWEPPDWIVVPGGNLGNTAAFGKALKEAIQLGLIDKIPRLAVIQAEGANPLYRTVRGGKTEMVEDPKTVATAIRIGKPVSLPKALRALEYTRGVVEQVSDDEILEAKRVVDRCGIGCEPASAASVAGAKKLFEAGVMQSDERVVGILTGNMLKDPEIMLKLHS